MVISHGHSEVETMHDHDKNIQALLQRYEELRVRLTADIPKLRIHEIPSSDHRATDQALCVDPAMVQVIRDVHT